MLQNDIALVTGASRGIGQAIAKALSGAGAKVIGTATSESGAAGISSWLGSNGRGAVLDVGNGASIDALLADLDAKCEMPTILVNYAAAKAGILGFTKSLAKEIASRGITVNAVAPGFIDTDMTRTLTDEQRTALTAQVPMSRLGTVEDIAQAVLFLCSPAAGYIT